MQQTLIAKHIVGLFNGVSEQTPALRLPSQANKQVNGWSSLTYGLTKRPPTRYISTLTDFGDSKTMYHPLNRGEDEKFIVAIKNSGDVSIFNLKGYKYPIIQNTEHKVYLRSLNAKKSISVTSIADYTFIANKDKVVSLKDPAPPQNVTHPAYYKVSLYSVSKGSPYEIRVAGATIASVSSTIDTTSGSLVTNNEVKTREQVLTELREAIASRGGFSATTIINDSFTFTKISGEDFTATASSQINLQLTPSTSTPFIWDRVGYVYVAKGVAEQNYTVIINGVKVATYVSGATTVASTYKTDVIAEQLEGQLKGVGGFSIERIGSVIKISKRDGSDFKLETIDSWGNAALKSFKGRCQSFSDLPARCFDGAVLQIIGKSKADESSYWVKYETKYISEGNVIQASGVWKESRKPDMSHAFNQATMPRQLVRKQDLSKYQNANNPLGIYFEIEHSLWNEREVGDDNSAPSPSFVGKGINAMILFSNRLAILAGQSICLSKTGDFLNFYPTTVTDALDDEPIDLDAPSSSSPTLLHALPCKDSLMLFASNQQFLLNSGNEPLTSKSVNVTSILTYPSSKDTVPLVLGQMAYFVTPNGAYNGIREYFLQADGLAPDAPLITEQVPTMLANDRHLSICGVANENLMFIVDNTNNLYVYKYFYNGDKKVQSAWSRWEFNQNILNVCEFDGVVYIIFENGFLEKLEFIKDNEMLYVDSLVSYQPSSRISTSNKTIELYDASFNFIRKLTPSDGVVSFNKTIYVGYPYTFEYEFSPIFISQNESEATGIIEGNSRLRIARLSVEGKSGFKFIVKPHLQSPFTYQVAPKDLTKSYFKDFLLRGEAKQSYISIISNESKSLTIHSASFEILLALKANPL